MRSASPRVNHYDSDLEPHNAEDWFREWYERHTSRWQPRPSRSDMEIFERDGWRCYICGVETPRGLMGTYRAYSPTQDHIMPRCLGGPHSYQNLRCACWPCNSNKSRKHPVRYWRERRCMSLQELAELVGMDWRLLDRLERGQCRGTRDVLAKLLPFGYASALAAWYPEVRR